MGCEREGSNNDYSSSLSFVVRKVDDNYDITNASGLSKNQVWIIRDILKDKEDRANDPIALDIKPLLKNSKYLEISEEKEEGIVRQYELIFECLSQMTCKSIAKAWIKIICPGKQGLFPYRNEKRKPKWWPKGVPHIEPDHLDKEGRLTLLISLIRNENVDIIALKRCLSYIKVPETDSKATHMLIYELFYINLYERLFFRYSQNLNLFNELPYRERSILKEESCIYIRVSVLDNPIRTFQPSMLNDKIYDIQTEDAVGPIDSMMYRRKKRRVKAEDAEDAEDAAANQLTEARTKLTTFRKKKSGVIPPQLKLNTLPHFSTCSDLPSEYARSSSSSSSPGSMDSFSFSSSSFSSIESPSWGSRASSLSSFNCLDITQDICANPESPGDDWDDDTSYDVLDCLIRIDNDDPDCDKLGV